MDETPLTGDETVAEPDETPVVVEPAPPSTRLPLAVLAALGVVAAGVALWVVVLRSLDKDYVGISVLIGMLVGYVLREVSRRSDMLVRVVAVVLTAIACVAGTLVASLAAWATKDQPVSMWTALRKEYLPHAWTYLPHLRGFTYALFGAALVVAYVSAMPPKPKKTAPVPAPAEPVEPVEDQST